MNNLHVTPWPDPALRQVRPSLGLFHGRELYLRPPGPSSPPYPIASAPHILHCSSQDSNYPLHKPKFWELNYANPINCCSGTLQTVPCARFQKWHFFTSLIDKGKWKKKKQRKPNNHIIVALLAHPQLCICAIVLIIHLALICRTVVNIIIKALLTNTWITNNWNLYVNLLVTLSNRLQF